MNWLESLLAYLFPTILIEQEDWRKQWNEVQRTAFLNVARIFFPLVASGYVLHFYLFDKRMGLEPLEFWFMFRMTTASLCLACFVLYVTKFSNTRHYKVPATLLCFGLCVSQAFVAKWYGLEAWVFCFFFVIASVMVIRTTALRSVAFALIVMLVQTPILLESEVALSNIISGASITIALTLAIRTNYLFEVRAFLVNEKHNEAQKRINELTLEFSHRVRSFIPKVIADRLERYVNDDNMSVLEASIESLKARKRDIACLFSDIRGYTQGSKNLDSFVNGSVMPEVKTCSDIVENHHGIPRKIGDLIFAYFDANHVIENVTRAIAAGIEIAQANKAMNATVNEMPIKRFILISSGEAMVGNFGGLDSSVEITALGSPVNFLSRLDEITKNPRITPLLDPSDLIVCPRTVRIISQSGIPLHFNKIDLAKSNVEIRDFPEIDHVYTLKPSDASSELIVRALHQLHDHTEHTRSPTRATGLSLT